MAKKLIFDRVLALRTTSAMLAAIEAAREEQPKQEYIREAIAEKIERTATKET